MGGWVCVCVCVGVWVFWLCVPLNASSGNAGARTAASERERGALLAAGVLDNPIIWPVQTPSGRAGSLLQAYLFVLPFLSFFPLCLAKQATNIFLD